MNTEHLAYILEAYKCGSVNKAAKNCYISQSTLSSIIKNVEDEIGYPLFRRTRTGLSPTPEGEVFMTHAEKIIIERRNIQRIPESMAENNNLSIICARSAFVLQCFFDFKKHFPCENSHDAFLEAGLRENLRTVVAQKCRVGIMVLFERVIPKYIDLADQYNLDFKVLKRSIPASVMHAKTHPIAQKKEVTLADLAQHPFVADAHIDYDDTLAILGLPDKHNFLYICDRGTIYDAVRKGGYVSIGISIPASDAALLGCQCRPVQDAEPMAVAFIHSRNFQLNARENQFIRYLTQRLEENYPTVSHPS